MFSHRLFRSEFPRAVFALFRTKIKHVQNVICGGPFKLLQLMQLTSRYQSVHDKVVYTVGSPLKNWEFTLN
jgi:hypothetical protein